MAITHEQPSSWCFGRTDVWYNLHLRTCMRGNSCKSIAWLCSESSVCVHNTFTKLPQTWKKWQKQWEIHFRTPVYPQAKERQVNFEIFGERKEETRRNKKDNYVKRTRRGILKKLSRHITFLIRHYKQDNLQDLLVLPLRPGWHTHPPDLLNELPTRRWIYDKDNADNDPKPQQIYDHWL